MSSLSRLRRSGLLAAVLATGLALSACGDDDDQQTVDTSAGVIGEAAPAPLAPFSVITPAQGAELIAGRTDIVVVDVRTPEEYAAGHLEGAVLVDIQAPTFEAQLAELATDGAYVVYCRSGNRSAQAVARMQDAGFTEVYDLGGIVAWEAAGYPVITG